VVVLAFGVAMGYLEAAVVVYLRAALGLGPPGVARELATLVMIAAVGWLAGRGGVERLAWAAVAFGAWDVVYYLGLRLVTGWPPALDAWDVLFLVPVPWVGPVWAPIVVSAALVGFGLTAALCIRAGRPIRVGPVRAVAATVGGALIIGSFLVDADRLRAGEVPSWSGWPLLGAGMLLATSRLRPRSQPRSRRRPCPEAGDRIETGGRPYGGSPGAPTHPDRGGLPT
jgi:hypothetical protein